MNYLSHAWRVLRGGSQDPHALAGVAVPDWLGVAARRTKCRSRDAKPHVGSSDPRLAALARGVCQHHADDAWFHESPAFGRLSLGFAKRLRLAFGESTSMRPWFLGHIVVELLLDAELARREPELLDRYYAIIESVDAGWVAESVRRMAGAHVGRLAEFIERYREVQFLRDYADDQRLVFRLNQVMQRVGLDALSEGVFRVLPGFRDDVAASFHDLIQESAETEQNRSRRSA